MRQAILLQLIYVLFYFYLFLKDEWRIKISSPGLASCYFPSAVPEHVGKNQPEKNKIIHKAAPCVKVHTHNYSSNSISSSRRLTVATFIFQCTLLKKINKPVYIRVQDLFVMLFFSHYYFFLRQKRIKK